MSYFIITVYRHLLVDECGPDPRVRHDAMRAVRVGIVVDDGDLLARADEGTLRDPLGEHNRVSTRPSRNSVRGEKGTTWGCDARASILLELRLSSTSPLLVPPRFSS